jgi:hypothetical protein
LDPVLRPNGFPEVLDRVATIAIVTCAVVMGWHAVWGSDQIRGRVLTPSYRVGDSVAVPDGLQIGVSGVVLVIVHSDCPYSAASMGFYRRLRDRTTAKMIVIGSEPEAVLRRYVASHEFRPDAVISAQESQFRIGSTPAVMHLGPDSRVRGYWEGHLRPEQELLLAEVLR